MEIIVKAAQLIIALALLIILHEGGHFLFAKLFKTRVEKFYLFFDYKFHLFSTYDKWFRKLSKKKPIVKKENGENEYDGTEYGIGWIPLGGYVKISGMIDESMDIEQMKQPAQPWEFRTKPAWQRLLIMLGGIIMNFIVAFFIYAMVIYATGMDYVKSTDMTYGMKFNQQAKADGFQDGDIIIGADDETFDSWNTECLRTLSNAKVAHVQRNGKAVDVSLSGEMNLLDMIEQPQYASILMPMGVDSVMPGSAAQKAGLEKGDVITAINETELQDFNDLSFALDDLRKSVNEESTAHDSLVARTVQLTFTRDDSVYTKEAVLSQEFLLGFTNKSPDYKITHIDYGFWESFPAGVSYGWDKLTGYVNDLKYLFTKKGARSVGGFIAIGNIFPSMWDWERFWLLTAFLSIILGIMNLLPIPALDGGHALFTIYEIITRRKPSDKFMEKAQYVGMFLLFALLIYANLNDILRLFGI